jgi:hypothetical protein
VVNAVTDAPDLRRCDAVNSRRLGKLGRGVPNYIRGQAARRTGGVVLNLRKPNDIPGWHQLDGAKRKFIPLDRHLHASRDRSQASAAGSPRIADQSWTLLPAVPIAGLVTAMVPPVAFSTGQAAGAIRS